MEKREKSQNKEHTLDFLEHFLYFLLASITVTLYVHFQSMSLLGKATTNNSSRVKQGTKNLVHETERKGSKRTRF
jgi:hypothetical protein